MKPIHSHSGQREIQSEANAVKVADRLASYVVPIDVRFEGKYERANAA